MWNCNFHDIEQNTDEWLNLRVGKITASNFDRICANMGKSFGKGAKDYAKKKALELVTKKIDEHSFSSPYFQRGHDLEPLAVEHYEFETFNTVSNGGFFENGTYGDSPDGLVGEHGVIEVKSVIPNVHWNRIEKGGYNTSYKWQIQGHLLMTGRDWCDFISYCPEFAQGKELHVHRVYPDDTMQEQLKDRLIDFKKLVDQYVKIIKE